MIREGLAEGAERRRVVDKNFDEGVDEVRDKVRDKGIGDAPGRGKPDHAHQSPTRIPEAFVLFTERIYT